MYEVGVRKPSEHPAQHHAVEAPGAYQEDFSKVCEVALPMSR